jgi:integrase
MPLLFNPTVPVDFAWIRKREESILQAEHALNTRRAYASAWKAFTTWCEAVGLDPLPATPQTVRDFLTWCIGRGYRIETLAIRASAIAYYHRGAGACPNPVDGSVRHYVSQARREIKEQPRCKRAVTIEILRRIGSRLSSSNPVDIRNRALILLCFAAGWRRSEIVALETSDVRFVGNGVELWQRSSKSDQRAEGRLVGIQPGRRANTCPVRALQEWLPIRGDWDGPLFVRFDPRCRITNIRLAPCGQSLNQMLKASLAAIGENASNYGAHSLRAGMVTEASKHGASEASIMQRTGHRSSRTLQRYIRPATAFDFNPLKDVL